MAELTTLARPYAKAAFESALQDGALGNWSEALVLLAAVSAEETVAEAIASPQHTADEKAEAMIYICADKLNDKQQNFIKILAENDRLALAPEISTLFELFKANQEQSVDVNIETAFELTEAQLSALHAGLKKHLAREVELSTSVNSDLLGGVFIRAGDTVIDDSIRGRLNKLAGAMSA
ncbi:F0F1 ATP synthase subunit delta [Agaribacterium haliotis]|uniref:F0F1 ATP synthase subunit delta n=1 Tax=Agaribacterium haliotis TaxID=2013869 RepID=UPI000BB534E0|nr:F0F1 ATP synthase subunit delta [Agaribacterium haliotis]